MTSIPGGQGKDTSEFKVSLGQKQAPDSSAAVHTFNLGHTLPLEDYIRNLPGRGKIHSGSPACSHLPAHLLESTPTGDQLRLSNY